MRKIGLDADEGMSIFNTGSGILLDAAILPGVMASCKKVPTCAIRFQTF